MSNNIIKPQRLKGFRDFMPDEAKNRLWLLNKISTVLEDFGFQPLETPALEYELLLTGKYSEEADKLIYGFTDRGNRRVALRYDQTVPLARVIYENKNSIIFPFKRYQIQLVWRAEKPQSGRFREFLQIDADILGCSTTVADAEILLLFAAIYKKIGFSSLKIKINDRRQLFSIIKDINTNLSPFSILQSVDKLDKISLRQVVDELMKKGLSQLQANKILDSIQQASMSNSVAKIIKNAVEMGADKDLLEYSPTLSRGLDYYTDMIFEGSIVEYKNGSIGGGGRYNNLINQLVGIDMPAVGFGIGFDRTLEAAEQNNLIPKLTNKTAVLITIFSTDLISNSLDLFRKLRKAGLSVECYLDPQKKMGQQLKYADKKGIPCVIIIGPDEIKNNLIVLKNLETKKQEKITIEQAINVLTNK